MDDFWDDLLGSWWGKMLMSLVLFLIAWAIFSHFSRMEAEGGSSRIVWYVALAYYIGGKWTVAGTFALMGLLLGYAGFRQLRDGHE